MLENQSWAFSEEVLYRQHLACGRCSIKYLLSENPFSSSKMYPVKHKSHEMLHDKSLWLKKKKERKRCGKMSLKLESRFFLLEAYEHSFK